MDIYLFSAHMISFFFVKVTAIFHNISVKYLHPSLTRSTPHLTTYHEGAGYSPSCPATAADDTNTIWGPEMSVRQGQQEVKISQGDRAPYIWSSGREN